MHLPQFAGKENT